MKEMTIEQKARTYDEALEKAKEFYILCKKCGAKDTVDFLENTFSELKESEDEKTPKWSEEDDVMVRDIIAAIDTLYYHGMVNWLKALKSRIGE